MKASRAIILAAVVLISSLVSGCGCLAAGNYDQPACQKYHTYWPPHRSYDD
ncbi:MAG TPA: hypothetical protein VGA73_13535 [Candidatus Binatia bacterium]